jgi:hypothetical protein
MNKMIRTTTLPRTANVTKRLLIVKEMKNPRTVNEMKNPRTFNEMRNLPTSKAKLAMAEKVTRTLPFKIPSKT